MMRMAETVTANRSVRAMACQFICLKTLRTSLHRRFLRLLCQIRIARGSCFPLGKTDSREIFPPVVEKRSASEQSRLAEGYQRFPVEFSRSALALRDRQPGPA